MDIIPSDKVKLDKENVEKDKSDIKSKKEAAEDLFSAHDFDITIDLGEILFEVSTREWIKMLLSKLLEIGK